MITLNSNTDGKKRSKNELKTYFIESTFNITAMAQARHLSLGVTLL
jgi:hypothetical protein